MALSAIGRFRYQVYVEEMGRSQPDADHERGLVLDDLDVGAYVIGAWSDGVAVGTLRINFCRNSDIGPYAQWYRIEQLAGTDWPARTAIVTRMMVAPAHRKTMLAARMAALAYDLGFANDIRYCFIDCNAHLLEFFSQMGWKVCGTFRHPQYGRTYIHLLDLNDFDHLDTAGSHYLRSVKSASWPKRSEHLRIVKPIRRQIFDCAAMNRASGTLIGSDEFQILT